MDGSVHSKVLSLRLSRLRDVVIRLVPPTFDQTLKRSLFSPIGNCPPITGCNLEDLALEFAEMNPDQKTAVEKVSQSGRAATF
jgi:hypothetical protein